MVAGGLLARLSAVTDRQPAAAREPGAPHPGKAILFEGCPTLERALRTAAGVARQFSWQWVIPVSLALTFIPAWLIRNVGLQEPGRQGTKNQVFP